jgi:hypothetical protein
VVCVDAIVPLFFGTPCRCCEVPVFVVLEALMRAVLVNLQVWTSRTQCLSLSRRAPLPSGTRCQAAAEEVEEPVTVDNSTGFVSSFVNRTLRFDFRMVKRHFLRLGFSDGPL